MTKDCVHVLAPLGLAFAAQHNARSNQVETTTSTTAAAAAIPILSAVGGPKDSVVAASNGDPLITYSVLVDEKKQGSGVVVAEVMAAISWMTRAVDKLENGNDAAVQVSISLEKETTKDLVESDKTADTELNGDEESDDSDGVQSDVSAATNTSSPEKCKAKPKPAFVTRIVRELSFKREINVRISKTQLEMKKMRLLISGYQAGVQRTLEQLNKEAVELDEERAGIKQRMASTLTRLTVDGFSRQLVDMYRSFQLLLLQENKLQRAKMALRQTILQTRGEECDWMSKSVGERFQQQVQQLSSQLSSKTNTDASLNCGHQAINQTLSADDPFFATPDHLHASNAQSKQLDLQLRSIAALIVTMRTKIQELITQTGESDELQSLLSVSALGQAPTSALSTVKRNSFKTKVSNHSSAMPTRQTQLRRVLSGVSNLIDLRASGARIQDDHALYNEHLNAFARLVSDQRTRAGRLVAAFHQKLADDARVDVEITTTMTMTLTQLPLEDDITSTSESTSEEAEIADGVSDAADEKASSNYYFSNPNVHTELMQSLGSDEQTVAAAIDVDQLPPPVWILAFARFLQKVIASEYALDQPLPTNAADVVAEQQAANLEEKIEDEGDEGDDGSHTNSEAGEGNHLGFGHHHITSERALEVCVHHFVFSKLSPYCFAYDQSRFCKDDGDFGCDVEAEEYHNVQQHHWKHSKQQMQGVSWELLAFPRDVATKIRAHLDRNNSNDQQQQHQDSFLPQALHAFKSVECESTPRGVIRAVMIAFTVLHTELHHLLNSNHDAATTTTTAFLSADVLIPSLVLMMSRLNHENELDLLWRRLNLVHVFESTLLSQGCEEAYYLTCLLGAMQVIQTFASDAKDGDGHQGSLATTRKSCDDCQKLVAYRHRHVTIKRCCDDDSHRSCGSQHSTVSTNAPVRRFVKTKSRKKLKDPQANPTPSQTAPSSSSLIMSDEADAVKNLSKWIASQASVESARASTDLVVAAHELWLYEQADADELDT